MAVIVKEVKTVQIPLSQANGVISGLLKMPYTNLLEWRRNNNLLVELEKQTQETLQPIAQDFYKTRKLSEDETISPSHPLWYEWVKSQYEVFIELPKNNVQIFTDKDLDKAIASGALSFDEIKYVDLYLTKK
ncbi:hypothetical protein D3C87_664140 [compost metagenome]